MKKIYALAVAALAASLTASAFNPIVPREMQTQYKDATKFLPVVIKGEVEPSQIQKAPARVIEDAPVDFPEQFTILTYVDVMANEERVLDELPEIGSSSSVTYEWSAIKKGYTMDGLFGYAFAPRLLWNKSTKVLGLEFGMTLALTNGNTTNYTYTFVGATENEDGTFSTISEKTYIDYTLDGWTYENYIGILATNKTDATDKGFIFLGKDCTWRKSNTEMAYTCDHYGDAGTVAYTDPVYTWSEGGTGMQIIYDSNGEEVERRYGDKLMFNKFCLQGTGENVEFTIMDDNSALASHQIAQFSVYSTETYENVMLISMIQSKDKSTKYINDFTVTGTLSEDRKVLTITSELESTSEDSSTIWDYYWTIGAGPNDEGKYTTFGGMCYNTVITMTEPVAHQESGIDGIAIDNEANVPAVYYNLQGVQVQNPKAGQVYIVKQGSKVAKQVIR